MTTALRTSVCIFVIALVALMLGAGLWVYHFLVRPSVGSILLPRPREYFHKTSRMTDSSSLSEQPKKEETGDPVKIPLSIPAGISMAQAQRLIRKVLGEDAHKARGIIEYNISFDSHVASFLSQSECLPDLIGLAHHPNLPAQTNEAHQLPLDHMPIIVPSVFPLKPAPNHQGLRAEDRAILEHAQMDENDMEEYHHQLTRLDPEDPLIYAFLMPDGFEEMQFPVVSVNKKINRPEPVVVAATCLPAGMQREEQILFILPRLLDRMVEVLLADSRTRENLAQRNGKPYPIMEFAVFEENTIRGQFQTIYLRQSTHAYCNRARIQILSTARSVQKVATKSVPIPEEEDKS
jgi:hypothetical protein